MHTSCSPRPGMRITAALPGPVSAPLTSMEMHDVHDVFDEFKHQLPDIDPEETQEWIESLDALVKQSGGDRARFVLYKLLKRARMLHVGLPPLAQTRYINTISPEQEPYFPGDEEMELHIRRLIRWNAVAMVVRANNQYSGIGGHLSTYASSASLHEVGFNHFFRGKDDGASGDQIFFQGHAAPGIYARAFVEGRLTESQLDHFRREVVRGEGLSSYPHPRLMPEFWEFPTVSMGLGPLAAIYQARFNRYLQHRGIKDTSSSRVWAFLGDGECDEPESLGALHVAAREGLDNLTFVVNCNLQRLDGPVRGNGKIIQELESVFRGSGWNVIKVLWSREWDELLARDVDGVLVNRMAETTDGESQRMTIADGAYIREHFFGTDPRLRKLVEHLSDDKLTEDPPYYLPGPDSPEIQYMIERRRALGGFVPKRVVRAKPLAQPDASAFAEFPKGSGTAAASTTMAFTRLLRNLLRDKNVGKRIVPIIPDEARTFGMDPLFKEVGIYSPLGQRYEPVDAETLLPYREAQDGQVLEEGITESGSMASLTAAGTSYATHGEPMLPFYVFYSMFGFQRTGDQIWAFGDSRGRGFMCGATAGRTTLNGEGLQHEDGHSHLLATALPNIRAYDPAFAYETAIIVKDGIRRMLGEGGEDIFYYLTLYNENYPQPPMPEGVEDGIVRGLYLFRKGEEGLRRRITLLGSGSIMRQVLRAQELLQERYEVAADVWSVTSYQLLRNEALEIERLNRLHPEAEPKLPYVTQILGGHSPIVAATDYVKSLPDQIARWSGSPFVPLGTDGFGRSDTREALRRHFEVDAESVATASLHALALCEQYGPADVAKAISDLGIDPAKH